MKGLVSGIIEIATATEKGIENVKGITWNVREKESATGTVLAVTNVIIVKYVIRETTKNVILLTKIPEEITADVDQIVTRSVKETVAVVACEEVVAVILVWIGNVNCVREMIENPAV